MRRRLKFHFAGTILLISHVAHAFILLTASIDDVKRIAKKFVSESLADKITDILAKASDKLNTNLSDENDQNEDEFENISNELFSTYKLTSKDAARQRFETESKRLEHELTPEDTTIFDGSKTLRERDGMHGMNEVLQEERLRNINLHQPKPYHGEGRMIDKQFDNALKPRENRNKRFNKNKENQLGQHDSEHELENIKFDHEHENNEYLHEPEMNDFHLEFNEHSKEENKEADQPDTVISDIQHNIGRNGNFVPKIDLRPKRHRESNRDSGPKSRGPESDIRPKKDYELKRDNGPKSDIRPKKDYEQKKDIGPKSDIRPKDYEEKRDIGPKSKNRPKKDYEQKRDIGPKSDIRPKKDYEEKRDIGPKSGIRPKKDYKEKRDIGPKSGPKKDYEEKRDIGPKSNIRPKKDYEEKRYIGPKSGIRPKKDYEEKRDIGPKSDIELKDYEQKRDIGPKSDIRPKKDYEQKRDIVPKSDIRPKKDYDQKRDIGPRSDIRPKKDYEQKKDIGPKIDTGPTRNIELKKNITPKRHLTPKNDKGLKKNTKHRKPTENRVENESTSTDELKVQDDSDAKSSEGKKKKILRQGIKTSTPEKSRYMQLMHTTKKNQARNNELKKPSVKRPHLRVSDSSEIKEDVVDMPGNEDPFLRKIDDREYNEMVERRRIATSGPIALPKINNKLIDTTDTSLAQNESWL